MAADTVTANIGLSIHGQPLRVAMTVPAGAARPADILPALRVLTDAVVKLAVDVTAASDAPISCRAGCGACCRQVVPVAPAEAHRLRAFVETLPVTRRDSIRARFAEAQGRLAAAGMPQPSQALGEMDAQQRREYGLAYFRAGVACPFLEDESCSIYAERPLACREYLVTSPAAHCARPTAAEIACVPMPMRVSRALQRLDPPSAERTAWLPLVDALAWADEHAEPPPRDSGPALLQQVFAKLDMQLPATADAVLPDESCAPERS
jgi:Fe-S-cluster containining protein